MIDFLEKLPFKDKFIEIDFEQYPFQLKINEDENLSEKFDYILKNLDSKDESVKKEISEYILNKNNNFIEIKYKNIINNIYRYPITFKLIYEKERYFKVFNENQLKDALSELNVYYKFWINGINVISTDIIEMKKSNQLSQNIIIMVPNIYLVSKNFRIDAQLEKKIKNDESFKFGIDKEQLEPFFLYIEKKEIEKEIGTENIKKSDYDLLKSKLTFIMNNKRKEFIKKLDDYIKIDIQTEPMMIIGNDGVGKSLTLQLYSLLENEEYKKLYFNLKLLQKCNIRDYIFVELIRGFVSKDDATAKKYLKKYLNCVNSIQKKIVEGKEFFEVLIDIINHLKQNPEKFVIILDQFDFESIPLQKFKFIRQRIGSYEKFKLIICCSLIDNENKKNLFSEYKNMQLNKLFEKNIVEFMKTPTLKKNKIHIFKEGTKLNDFNFIISEKEEKNEIDNKEIEMINKNNIMDIEEKEEKEEKKEKKEKEEKKEKKEKQNIKEKEKEDKKLNEIIDTKKIGLSFEEKNQDENIEDEEDKIFHKINSPDFKFSLELDNKTKSQDKLKIYYNNLISMEDMIQDIEIKECMSYFNYIPKYYYKFYLFQIINKIKGEENISNIISNFYEFEYKNIENNIYKFYSKLDLNESKETNKNLKLNVYNFLLKLQKSIRKTYEQSIPLYKLHHYSLIFPFKYINILTKEDGQFNINFNEDLKRTRFKLRYSFPFIENVIQKMLKDYNDDNKLDISELSGSAFGNALEIKIRENLKTFEEKIEIRYVWSLNSISDSVKKEKLSEINKKKESSERYKNLDDIKNSKVNIKLSKNEYFYFKPENQDNKYFDSLLLIKNNNEFDMIAFQITKNKKRKSVKSKKTYTEYLINNVKVKFEKLYGISITSIYFWYILNNDSKDNMSLCGALIGIKIPYVFYSISKKCFFESRDKLAIKSIKYFLVQKSLVYSRNNFNLINYSYETFDPYPATIKMFEQSLYKEYKRNTDIFFESYRYNYYGDNFGPKIDDRLKKNIINTIAEYLTYSNEFEIMFLFGFDISYYKNFKALSSNELLYLIKIKGNIYLLFEDKSFKFDDNNNLKICKSPIIDINSSAIETRYHNEEFEFSLIDDILENSIMFLFKIYYLGKELFEK